jgi:hypothetical protein
VKSALLALPILLFAGCSDVTDVAEALDVRVERVDGNLFITNGRDAPIYYFVVNEDVLPLIEWAPCVSGPGCPEVPAQTIRRLPLTEVPGGSNGVLLFYWWHASPGPGGPVADAIRSLRID